jgi:phospholipid transport system transporter-binding protein
MKLPDDATIEQAATLAQGLPAAVAEGSGVLQIDASGVRSCDSSTLALLLQAHRLAQAAGRQVEVVGAPAKLVQLATLYGIEDLLAFQPVSR